MKGTGSGIAAHREALRRMKLDDGGFSHRPGGVYRADATAWAVIALAATGTRETLLDRARTRLASGQEKDGRVCISPDHPEAYWPTPLAVLAWHNAPAHLEARSRAVRFLAAASGRHFERDPGSPLKHDPSVKGWPWIENSHSMIEPTALSLIALQAAGNGDNERTREGTRMLMDRQLPQGGWNYGNTLVYGQELYPQPENTGLALSALAGTVARKDVSRSLEYLESRIVRVRSPLSLGWGLLGLGAWGARPGDAGSWVLESFELQRKYGQYGTALVSLLLVAFAAEGGLVSVLESSGSAS